ncbi:hypothetical protein [Paenibacillus sp. MMS20-IR301]|uniref:hypothetical protein n=1 Tax=Paenibacillus sp. MMS20-IR301 TaxID=2895946 RepID=UPI0028E80853|nr:hypothetical protein [Paenibacillus sp. MMS20-IR301]WNS44693.1 hypothetical protein LOS79_05305 [Paenibacillus sp. MMS20-IR301]
MLLQLVPLRIPTGWTVKWNIFTEVSTEDFTDEEHVHWMEYSEDLLLLVNNNNNKILDLGWYPEGKPQGQYTLLLIDQYDDIEQQTAAWDTPLVKFKTRDIDEVKLKIEKVLLQVNSGDFS